MNVLTLSLDHKTLLYNQVTDGSASQGDTADRQRKYGELVDNLDIVVTSPPGFVSEKLSEDVSVYPTNKKSFIGHGLFALKQARKKKYDLIVAQDLTAPAAFLISKLTHTPYLITFHGADFESADFNHKRTDRMLKPFIKWAVKHANGLRVVSRAMKENFERMGVNCSIEVIPTAADYTLFAKDITLPNPPLDKEGDSYVILSDGRLEKVKNYPLLFKAFKKVLNDIPQAQLHIIGTGSLESDLKKQVADLDLTDQVTFLGGMGYADLVPHYQSCDLFVLASDSESLGKVLLQAGAAQKPVVSTKTLGAKGIVEDGVTGFLVDIGNADQMAEKIIALLNDTALRTQMGETAQKKVLAEYDSATNIKQFVDFWKRVATGFKPVTTN